MASHQFESTAFDDSTADRSTDWEVGKGKPPVEHRFQKGRSGNPAGRPRRTGAPGDRLRGADEPSRPMILDEADRMVTVREGDAEITLSMREAVFRTLGAAALKGNQTALRRWTEQVQAAEKEQKRAQLAIYNVLERDEKEREDKMRDWDADDGYDPYAEDILIDTRSGTVVIRGDGDER